jgi:hypothetical protein
MRTQVLRVKCDDKVTSGAPYGNQTARNNIFKLLALESVHFFFFCLEHFHNYRSEVVTSSSPACAHPFCA